jgi:hypothetical protein
MHSGATYRLTCDSHSQPNSILLAVTDDTGRVVGEASLVVGETWQLTSFRVQHHGVMVAAALCHGIVQALRVNRVRNLTTRVDGAAWGYLTSFGLRLATCSVAELLDQQRRTNPEGYSLVSQGHGLDDVEFPYLAELLTAPAVAPALAR